MDFGQLQSVNGVVFDLPPIDPRTERLLQSQRNGSAPKISIGCPVWNCEAWKGSVYPEKAKSADFLHHYSRQFNSIELNATFYRTPTLEQTRAWIEKTPEGFLFYPKIHQAISHENDAQIAEVELERTLVMLKALFEAGRLGIPFLQLSPQWAPAQTERLKNTIAALSTISPIAVEFRHPQWFFKRLLIGRAFELLTQYDATAVITDTSGRRDVSHSTLTSKRTLVRFLGNTLHPTDYERIDAWIDRLAEWTQLGLEEIAFFIHQPDNANAPELSNLFIEKLNARIGTEVAPWKPIGQITLL